MAALSDIPLLIHQLLTICFFKHLGSLQLSFQLSSDAKRERERETLGSGDEEAHRHCPQCHTAFAISRPVTRL